MFGLHIETSKGEHSVGGDISRRCFRLQEESADGSEALGEEALSGQLSVVSRAVDFLLAQTGGAVLERAAKKQERAAGRRTGWDSGRPVTSNQSKETKYERGLSSSNIVETATLSEGTRRADLRRAGGCG